MSKAEPDVAPAPADEPGAGQPDGEPGRPKAQPRRSRKKPDASPESAEEALHVKAEAARIAAEVFAAAPQARHQVSFTHHTLYLQPNLWRACMRFITAETLHQSCNQIKQHKRLAYSIPGKHIPMLRTWWHA